MPDSRTHRGKHPDDDAGFAVSTIPALRRAVGELSWLLGRGYAPDSALKLVGDRYSLTARQRRAVRRSACTDEARVHRQARRVGASGLAGQSLGIDGYNVLITVESALSGGVILVGRDGATRDLASIHGTYRQVEETIPALRLILCFVAGCGPSRVDWLLDRPVSNSARLRAGMMHLLEEMGDVLGAATWGIDLADDPDAALASYRGVVATSDSVILDACAQWVDLPGEIIAGSVPNAWRLDFCRG